jgi:hypothetical protein
VRLQHGETGDWTQRALVDTGAPITFFDRGAADAVGVRIGYAGAQTSEIRILGGHWRVQFEMVDLCLVDQPEYNWAARVAFVVNPELQMPFQGVLGTDGFLDKFAVTFNRYYDYFAIERPDDWHERVGQHLTRDAAQVHDIQWERPERS